MHLNQHRLATPGNWTYSYSGKKILFSLQSLWLWHILIIKTSLSPRALLNQHFCSAVYTTQRRHYDRVSVGGVSLQNAVWYFSELYTPVCSSERQVVHVPQWRIFTRLPHSVGLRNVKIILESTPRNVKTQVFCFTWCYDTFHMTKMNSLLIAV